MNKFVVVTKMVGDLEKRPPEHKKSSPMFPLACQEFETREEAHAAFPGRPCHTIEEYDLFKTSMNAAHGIIKKPTPWWRFWSKK